MVVIGSGEYAVGGRRGLIILPEGREVLEWRSFAAELRKVVAFFDFLSQQGKQHFASTTVYWWLSISQCERLFLGFNG